MMTDEQHALLIRLDEKVLALTIRVDNIGKKVDKLDKVSTKIGGGLFVIMAVGAALAWAYDKVISKIWHFPN